MSFLHALFRSKLALAVSKQFRSSGLSLSHVEVRSDQKATSLFEVDHVKEDAGRQSSADHRGQLRDRCGDCQALCQHWLPELGSGGQAGGAPPRSGQGVLGKGGWGKEQSVNPG